LRYGFAKKTQSVEIDYFEIATLRKAMLAMTPRLRLGLCNKKPNPAIKVAGLNDYFWQ